MARPPINHLVINEHLALSECHPDSECRTNNWWLYDTRVGMNIGMRTKTRDGAFVEAIEYWAGRSERYEQAYNELKAKVDAFVSQLEIEE